MRPRASVHGGARALCRAKLSRDNASRHALDAIRRYVYPFCCHVLLLTSVLRQVSHPSTSTRIEYGDHRNTGQASPCSLPSLHSPLRRATSCSVATPRSSLPFGLCPYTSAPYAYRGHTTHLARFHRFCTIVDFDQAGNDGTQTRVHTLFGQTVQLSGDRGRLAVVADDSNDERADDDDTPKRPQTTQVRPAFTTSRRDGDQGERRGSNVQRSMTRRE